MITRTHDGRQRGRSITAFAVAALVLLAGCGSTEESTESAGPSTDNESSSTDSSGRPSGLVINTIDGGQVDFGDVLGQDTVLWFWAPW